MFNKSKNFEEDYPIENGNYIHTCKKCGDPFMGHKRRVYCKVCLESLPEIPKVVEEHLLWRETFKEVFYVGSKLDLKKLEAEIDELLALETKESLLEFLAEQRSR